MARMTPAQRAYLEKKIASIYGYTAQEAARQKFRKPDTAQIAKYREAVKAHDKANKERDEIVNKAFSDASLAAKEAVLFMEPTEALAYVNALKPVKVG